MNEKINIPPEREIAYMQNAAEAANEAALPVIRALGNLGIHELMPSRDQHAQVIDEMEATLILKEWRDSAMQGGKVEGGQPLSWGEIKDAYLEAPSLEDSRTAAQNAGRTDIGQT